MVEFQNMVKGTFFEQSWPAEIQAQLQLVKDRFVNIPILVGGIRSLMIFLMLLEKKRISILFEVTTWDFVLERFLEKSNLTYFRALQDLLIKARDQNAKKNGSSTRDSH